MFSFFPFLRIAKTAWSCGYWSPLFPSGDAPVLPCKDYTTFWRNPERCKINVSSKFFLQLLLQPAPRISEDTSLGKDLHRSQELPHTDATCWILSPYSEIYKQLEPGEVFGIIYSTTSAFIKEEVVADIVAWLTQHITTIPFFSLPPTQRLEQLSAYASLAAGVLLWFCPKSKCLLGASEMATPFASDRFRSRGLLSSPSSGPKCRPKAWSHSFRIETIRPGQENSRVPGLNAIKLLKPKQRMPMVRYLVTEEPDVLFDKTMIAPFFCFLLPKYSSRKLHSKQVKWFN